MKKLRGMQQLKAEQLRLEQQQELLEVKIRTNWIDLKESLRPVNVAKETFSKVLSSEPAALLMGSGLLKGALAFGIGLLSKKIADKGLQKLLGKFFKKG